MAKDVIIALDFKNKEECLNFLDKFDERLYVKVGLELFYSEGPQIINEIKKRGHKIFLDLKLHDIPNTVKGAANSLKNVGADMTNLHICGGSSMIKAAREVFENSILIGVTVLTSTDEETLHKEILVDKDFSLEETVISYAKMGKENGLDGIVCSALEVPKIKEKVGKDFLTVTPGIRLDDSSNGDQKRVVTPKYARELGSDYIVVGRPITKSEDPLNVYKIIKKEFVGE